MLRAAVTQLRQDEKDSIEYRAVLATALEHAEAERDALAALLRSVIYRLNGSQDVCAAGIIADIDAALAGDKP